MILSGFRTACWIITSPSYSVKYLQSSYSSRYCIWVLCFSHKSSILYSMYLTEQISTGWHVIHLPGLGLVLFCFALFCFVLDKWKGSSLTPRGLSGKVAGIDQNKLLPSPICHLSTLCVAPWFGHMHFQHRSKCHFLPFIQHWLESSKVFCNLTVYCLPGMIKLMLKAKPMFKMFKFHSLCCSSLIIPSAVATNEVTPYQETKEMFLL